jgi:uncharacterized protein involved in type VI secretion and phage assembly
MSENGFNLYDQMSPDESAGGGRAHGVVEGIVSEVDSNGRVKVVFEWMLGVDGRPYVTDWTRVVAPGAGGKGRGLLVPLAKDDEVLVAFRFGNFEQPYVLGGLWNTKTDWPPAYPFEEAKASDVDPNRRILRSSSGHTIVLDDTKGKETITIVDKGKKNQLLFETKDGKVTIKADKELVIVVGNSSIVVGNDDVTVSTSKFVVKAGTEYSLTIGSTVIGGKSGALELKGSRVTVNDGALEVT